MFVVVVILNRRPEHSSAGEKIVESLPRRTLFEEESAPESPVQNQIAAKCPHTFGYRHFPEPPHILPEPEGLHPSQQLLFGATPHGHATDHSPVAPGVRRAPPRNGDHFDNPYAQIQR
ncbi:MAG: hypothetical protein RLZ25_1942 [Pseudomonadota bacterium]